MTTPNAGHCWHESEPTYSVTKNELDMIKNNCAYPESQFCDGCEYADGEDPERASGLGCNFIGANALMDEVLTRKQPSAEHDATIRREAYEQGARDERERVLEVISDGKSALYEIKPDGNWDYILQAKMDVLCWIEESLRSSKEK